MRSKPRISAPGDSEARRSSCAWTAGWRRCVVGHDGRVPSVVRDRWKPSDPVGHPARHVLQRDRVSFLSPKCLHDDQNLGPAACRRELARATDRVRRRVAGHRPDHGRGAVCRMAAADLPIIVAPLGASACWSSPYRPARWPSPGRWSAAISCRRWWGDGVQADPAPHHRRRGGGGCAILVMSLLRCLHRRAGQRFDGRDRQPGHPPAGYDFAFRARGDQLDRAGRAGDDVPPRDGAILSAPAGPRVGAGLPCRRYRRGAQRDAPSPSTSRARSGRRC